MKRLYIGVLIALSGLGSTIKSESQKGKPEKVIFAMYPETLDGLIKNSVFAYASVTSFKAFQNLKNDSAFNMIIPKNSRNYLRRGGMAGSILAFGFFGYNFFKNYLKANMETHEYHQKKQ